MEKASGPTRRTVLVQAGAVLIAAAPGAALATQTDGKIGTMNIQRSGGQPSRKGPDEWFTGPVRIDPLFTAPEPARVSGGSVTFEPGARTAWHTHPLGQTLIVTAGLGWVQTKVARSKRSARRTWSGSRPGEKHWHGASPTTALTHIAIQESLNGKNVDWLEKVSDSQYRK